MSKQIEELIAEAKAKKDEALALQASPDLDAQDAERRDALLKEANTLAGRALEFKKAEKAIRELEDYGNNDEKQLGGGFRGVGHWFVEFAKFHNQGYRIEEVHEYFRKDNQFKDSEEERAQWIAQKSAHKDLVESVGASGGFLVPVEYRPELLGMVYEQNPIRQRATVVPMRRRQLDIPTIDQTGTTAGQSRQFGGIIATWTEEAATKSETQPAFRKISLVAHKLVTYTEVSDEMLDDDAVGLLAVMNGPLGWAGAIRWEEEYTFLRGTGVGQPLGIVNAGATFRQTRAAANAIGIVDIFNMVAHHQGENPMWSITRAAMPQLLQLNGPAANPSYLWIMSARDRMPMSLMGFPVSWTEKLPQLGQEGDICLCDWAYYLVGDRQATTIESSQHYRFQNDLMAWRAVHRVDGQPWLSAPITTADGSWQISPFVILDDTTTT